MSTDIYRIELPEGTADKQPDGPPYKSTRGYYTISLFWDQIMSRPITDRLFQPVFTLHEDKPGLINARKTFVEEGDPTGYKWAIKYLGEWPHWLKLMETRWFREAHEIWCNELRASQTATALEQIKAIAKGTGPASFQAAKFLANREWEDKSRRGRPSKQEVDAELKRAIGLISAEEEDYNRLKLVSVGGKNV